MPNESYLCHVPLTMDLVRDLASAAITIANEDSDYPDTNIGTDPMADVARTTSIPAGGCTIRLDFGENVIPRFWAFLNHNVRKGNWVIRSYNDAFITGSGESVTVIYRDLDARRYYRGWTAKRYWEVSFVGCRFKDAFGLELGKLIAATDRVTFSGNFTPGVERGMAFRNEHNDTAFGLRWSHIKQENINMLGLSWDPHIKDLVLDQLTDFIQATNGGAYPVLIIPDMDEDEFYYMRNQDALKWTERSARSVISRLSMSFVEESRGKVQAA